jgi:glycosyltransferase involved in cell wall biosynthesis
MTSKNQKKPMVSVIIPTYNRGFCIEQTLETVFKQTYTDFEIIVVDDGSTDNTASIIKNYDGQIKYIYQQNSGASAARNTGIHNANGDWIAFLDSDDEWFTDKLKVQMDDLVTYPNAIAHMVDAIIGDQQQFQDTLFDLRGTRTKYAREPLRQHPLIDVLETQFFTSCWLLNRDAIKAAGYFDTSKRIFEDIDLLSRVALQGAFVVNCFVGTLMRRKPGESGALSDLYQTSRQESLKNLAATFKNLLELKSLSQIEERYIKKELAANYFELALINSKTKKSLFFYGDLKESVHYDYSLFNLVKVIVVLTFGKKGYERLRNLKKGDQKSLRRSSLEE